MKKVKVGDKLVRMLAGTLPLHVVVGEVTDNEFKVGDADGIVPWEEGWTFCRETGFEIDHDLGFGPKYGISGSFIKDFKKLEDE